MSSSEGFKEKLIIVTGASSGIGRATAIHLSSMGARLVLIARSENRLRDTLENLTGTGHSYYVFDFNNTEQIGDLILRIKTEQGVISGLVHCAGIAPMRPLSMSNFEFMHTTFKVNFYSFVELMRNISKKGIFVTPCSCVAISSIAGKVGYKSKVAYCSSKAALDGGIRSLAKELSSKGIRVNSVVPGYIETEMTKEDARTAGTETYNDTIFSRQYLGVGTIQDVSSAITFLLGEESRFITGTGLVVDGGYLS
jgi:NAD(P)-dependent dehydrogenase (short-subunit alcohol dehydrogenase family)